MKGGILKPGRATGPMGAISTIDPVCGMHLSERDPQRASEREDKLYYFCSDECKQRFDSATRSMNKAKQPEQNKN